MHRLRSVCIAIEGLSVCSPVGSELLLPASLTTNPAACRDLQLAVCDSFVTAQPFFEILPLLPNTGEYSWRAESVPALVRIASGDDSTRGGPEISARGRDLWRHGRSVATQALSRAVPTVQFGIHSRLSDHRRVAGRNCIDHLLKQFPYAEVQKEPVVLPQREHHEHYSRQAVPEEMLVPEVY
jgi:hypothetical protein